MRTANTFAIQTRAHSIHTYTNEWGVYTNVENEHLYVVNSIFHTRSILI